MSSIFNPRVSASINALADLKLPKDLHISPDGSKVVYALDSFSRKDKYAVSSLWIAEVGKNHSARQITSGLFRDEKPRWSPDGQSIAFLSNRAKKGESAIYMLSIGGFSEAYPVAKVVKGVKEFEWSGDGRFIAFVSADGSEEIDETGENEPIVFGGEDKSGNNQRLHVVDVERGIIHTLTPLEENVDLFSWSPKALELAYTVPSPGSESQISGTQINIVSADSGPSRSFISTKGPITSLVWSQPDKLHFIARQTPPYTKLSVYEARIKSKQYGSYFGWDGEAVSLHRARDSVIAHVRNHSHEALHALGVDSQSWPFPSFYQSEYEITSLDAFRKSASDDFTLVLARSSPQVANEVWSVTVKKSGYALVKLSSHNSSFDGFRSKRISATGPDGWECDGWLFSPKPVTIPRRLPPTVVLLQSHPALLSFSMGPHLDVAHLTAAGYAVLCPNLRRTTGDIGEQYTDVLAILRKAVSKNLVDESRVTISGWSDGGFLSSLAVIRNDFSFQAVVCGGGIVDWGFVDANSDPFWPSPDIPSLFEDGDRSPAWETLAEKTRKTPLLILHGREDDEVPVSGPLAFWREKQRWNGPVQMVLYPKEKHVIRDRKHLIDLWTRVLQFYDKRLV
ncbi:S9 family peptidase [Aspergillus stella-maris]|uniref:S9 family peptidase n=1 Tax=Aspergillus stella-maris TaxID=1810926 RepID=UPI003CCCDA66